MHLYKTHTNECGNVKNSSVKAIRLYHLRARENLRTAIFSFSFRFIILNSSLSFPSISPFFIQISFDLSLPLLSLSRSIILYLLNGFDFRLFRLLPLSPLALSTTFRFQLCRQCEHMFRLHVDPSLP